MTSVTETSISASISTRTSTSTNGIRDARERILATSYELFARRGIRDVSVDEIIAASGVAKATLYRHFVSKDHLVLAFLDRRERVWTLGLLDAGVRARAEDPEARLLAIFDVLDEWFQRGDFEACSFVNALLEMGPAHPAGRASIAYLANIRELVAGFAADAGLQDPSEFARSWHILMKGAIVQAAEGDRQAALRAKSMGAMLIEQFRLARGR
jgi:AcrR family transcriptional regulator